MKNNISAHNLDFNKIRDLISKGEKLEAIIYCSKTAQMNLSSAKFLVENLEDIDSGKVDFPQKNYWESRNRCVIKTENGRTSIFYEDNTTPYTEITPQHPKWEEAKATSPVSFQKTFEAIEKDHISSHKNTVFFEEKNNKYQNIIIIMMIIIVSLYLVWKI